MPRPHRIVPILSLLLACTGDASDSGADAAPEDLTQSLPNPGPWGVGYTTAEMTYADTVTGTDRPLPLHLWYPSPDDTLDGSIYYRFAITVTGAEPDATLASGRFPIAVLSHGHQSFADGSAFLSHHLASHGWLVIAPDHTNNTWNDGDNRTTEIYAQRPLDVSAVLDHLLSGGVTAFADAFDADHVVAIGHSFGGYTLFSAAGARYDLDALLPECAAQAEGERSSFCSTMTDALADRLAQGFSEPRVDAWIPMAPGDQRLFGPDGLGGLSAPFLLMEGDLDPRAGDNPDQYWAGMDGADDRYLRVLGGGHFTFTDQSGQELIDGLIPREEGWPIINAYALAFARRHALGDETVAPVLDGELSLFDAAELVP